MKGNGNGSNIGVKFPLHPDARSAPSKGKVPNPGSLPSLNVKGGKTALGGKKKAMAYDPLSTGGGKPPTNYGAGPQRPAGMKFPPRPRPPAGPSFRPPGTPPPTPPRPGAISNQFGRGTAPPAQGGQYAAATAPGTAGHGGPG